MLDDENFTATSANLNCHLVSVLLIPECNTDALKDLGYRSTGVQLCFITILLNTSFPQHHLFTIN